MTTAEVRVATGSHRPWLLSASTYLIDLPEGWTQQHAQREVQRLGPVQGFCRSVPTRGLLGALLAAGILHLLGRVTENSWLALGSGALLALPAVAYLLRPRLGELEVVRVLHTRGAVGEQVETSLLVTNTGGRRSPALLAVDEMPGHQSLRVPVASLRPGAHVEVRSSRDVLHRTSSLGGVVRLRADSPVGLVGVRQDRLLSGDVRAHPASVPAPALTHWEGGAGTSNRPVAGIGSEVLGLRPWRAGDSTRAVSARATARHGRPLVLEREREQEPALVVLVGGGGRGPAWETVVARAAALTVDAVRSGVRVVLLGLPGPTQPTPVQVLDAFAAADAAAPLDDEAMRRALAAAGPRGRLVLVVPPDAVSARLTARRACAVARCDLVVLDA